MTEIEKPSMTDSKVSSPFRRDLSIPMFSLEESYDKIIDVKASFIPEPICRTTLIRTFFFLFTLASTGTSFLHPDWIGNIMWFGYLTHISATLTIVYFGLMMICSFNTSLIPQPEAGADPNSLTRLVWVLYSLVTVFEIALSIFYWAAVYDPEWGIEYHRVALHGLFVPVLLFDGCILGKIPVRIKQVIFLIIAGLIYMVWTIIHSLLDIGKSVSDRADGDGDPLYSILNWQDDPLVAAIASFFAFCILMPVMFLVVWMLSLYSPCCNFDGRSRRVIVAKDKSDDSPLV